LAAEVSKFYQYNPNTIGNQTGMAVELRSKNIFAPLEVKNN